MKPSSLVFVLSLALTLPALAQSQRAFNQYDFPLEPGATVSIVVTFNSTTENAVSFWDRRDPPGTRFHDWPGCGNYDPSHPKSFQYKNSSPATIPFAFNAGYKKTPPNPNEPWHSSSGVVRAYSDKEIVIGYPNSLVSGSNPSNTEITVTISAGRLPDPRLP